MDVPELLREARLRAHLSQAALAARAGTSRAALNRYEKGTHSPTVRQLELLLRACGSELRARLEPVTLGADALLAGPLEPLTEEEVEDHVRAGARFAAAGAGWALDGRAALAAHGLGLPRDAAALVVEDVEAARRVLAERGMTTGSPPEELYRSGWVAARREVLDAWLLQPLTGAMGVLRLRLHDGPPPHVLVDVAGTALPVVPLPELVRAHRELAQVLARAQETGHAWCEGRQDLAPSPGWTVWA